MHYLAVRTSYLFNFRIKHLLHLHRILLLALTCLFCAILLKRISNIRLNYVHGLRPSTYRQESETDYLVRLTAEGRNTDHSVRPRPDTFEGGFGLCDSLHTNNPATPLRTIATWQSRIPIMDPYSMNTDTWFPTSGGGSHKIV